MLYPQRQDPFTGEYFYPKRYNQKFASRKNQVGYNNQKALKKRHRKRKIDAPLDRNRNVLKNVLGKQKSVIKSRDWLMALGYDFGIYTHSIRVNGQVVACVYEFQLSKISDNMYKISKDEQY